MNFAYKTIQLGLTQDNLDKLVFNIEWNRERDAKLHEMIQQNLTDGFLYEPDDLVFKRIWRDESSAKEFAQFIIDTFKKHNINPLPTITVEPNN